MRFCARDAIRSSITPPRCNHNVNGKGSCHVTGSDLVQESAPHVPILCVPGYVLKRHLGR